MGIFNKKSKKEKSADLKSKENTGDVLAKNTKETSKSFSAKSGFSSFILIKPWLSEKAMKLRSQNQYVFLVKPDANKKLVWQEIERRFNVKVKAVNIVRKKREKKAIVTLMPNQQIDI